MAEVYLDFVNQIANAVGRDVRREMRSHELTTHILPHTRYIVGDALSFLFDITVMWEYSVVWKVTNAFWTPEEALETLLTARCFLQLVEAAVERPLTQTNAKLLMRFNQVINGLETRAGKVQNV